MSYNTTNTGYTRYSSWGRTRQPKNLAGKHATSAKTAIGDGSDKGNLPTLVTHGLKTENQRFLHLTLKDNADGLTIKLYAYSHASGLWGEFIPAGGGTTTATIAASGKTIHKVFNISGVDRVGFVITSGTWDDTNDAFFAAGSTF
tara:strand:+ start:159 stop:593 length:435 start_codon:yes stop_codon:yes gene_type:complete